MIVVLMATYNGEKYIFAQIESLLLQTEQNFIVYVNDDYSTDGTYDIQDKNANRYPEKIIISQSSVNSGSAKHNFIRMMIAHKDDYIMLCDQDDVWKPDKIALTLQKVQEMEQECGRDTPILVHTDLEVVDERLQMISPSFKKLMNADYSRTALNQILIQNTLTGCTAMYNFALARLISDEPEYMVMHDWWIILIASAFGKVGHIEDKTILYRQHGQNLIGAKDVGSLSYQIDRLLHGTEVKQAIIQTYQQADNFYQCFTSQLSIQQKHLLREYIGIPSKKKIGRVHMILKLRTMKHGCMRKLANLIFV